MIFLSAKGRKPIRSSAYERRRRLYHQAILPRELVARVKSCLRRASYAAMPVREDVVACRGIEINRTTHRASLHGTELTLTPKEFDVLALLLEAHGKPVATSELYEKVWGEQFLASSANSVMVHIRHLRTKLSNSILIRSLLRQSGVWVTKSLRMARRKNCSCILYKESRIDDILS